MNRPMPALASVFYLRLADFSRKPVAEQARLRSRLEAAVGAALVSVTPQDRAVLDAPDGFVLVMLTDPAEALSRLETCLAAAVGLPLCVGGNHGPVAVAVADDPLAGLTGDGIRAAASAAAFAQAGQMLLTSAFRAALAEASPDRSVLLRRAGVFSDASVRTHELFASDPRQGQRRRLRLALAAGVAAAAVIAGGATLRGTLPSLGLLAGKGSVALDVTPQAEVFVDGKRRGMTPPLQQVELRAGSHVIELRHGDDPPHVQQLDIKPGQRVELRHLFVPPATVRFDISPGGEVFVDGASRGGAPALEELELPAGAHHVEVRHPDFEPYVTDIELKSKQTFVLKHTFSKFALLSFDIKPGGQVYVDGELKGQLPDLQQLEVSAGRHLIEVRQGDFPPYELDVTLKPGEEVVVRHRFERSKPAEFFRKLKKKLGLSK